jgi:predicted flap endonuclease-1-like 5' DNA nuclease
MSIALVTLLSLAILVVGFLVGWLVGGIGTTLSSVAFLALPVLVIGFLIGWLVEWIIDNQYRRLRELGQASGPVAVPVPVAGASAAPPADISELTQMLRGVLSEREIEMGGLRENLEQQAQKYDQLRARFEQYAATHPDDLTVVKGIGRIYQWKLRDAGYSTYGQLAEADADEIRQILDVKSWQKTDPQSWIEQAKTLIKRDDHRQEE